MKPPPFAALAARLGIDLDAMPTPEPIDGPVVLPCYAEPDGTRCSGKLRLVERGDPICILHCDTCDLEAGIPARRIDPEVGRRRRLEHAEIPQRFFGVKFEQDEENREALEAVRSWLAEADANPMDRARSLVPAPAIFGEPGRGKSHMLAAVAVRLVRQLDLSVWFRSARRMLADLQQFENAKAVDETWHRATTVDVLCLDDLGAPRGTEWRQDRLADLIDERYERELPVLVATNYPPGMWGDVMDGRTHSRLRGMTFGVELRGPDRRRDEQESHA